MEEKERYEFLDGSKYAAKYGLDYWDDWDDSVYDRINKEIVSTKDIVNLLNQQDERIKELNTKLIERKEFCESQINCLLELNNNLLEENQQLKQQLHDLPKKIVGEIRKQIIKDVAVTPDYHDEYDLRLSTRDKCIECLDAILKKYREENDTSL